MKQSLYKLITLLLLMISVTASSQESPSSEPEPVTYDFDDSTMQGWTTIDADNDGYTWVLASQSPGVYHLKESSQVRQGHNGSMDMVISGSYTNITSEPLTPDNYLVSPKVMLGGSITFWANAQDESYPADHFGVAVSTKGNTNAADFTTIQDWTMTASRQASFVADARQARAPRRAQGTWYKYAVDLSAYAGQEGYVAIRHFNSTDQFILNIDDITISPSPLLLRLTPPANLSTTAWTMARGFNTLNDYESEEAVLQIGIDGKDVYVQGISYYLPEAWIKGTMSDDGKSITFESFQYYGCYDNTYDIWFVAGNPETNEAVPITVTYDAEAGVITWPTNPQIVENGSKDELKPYGFYEEIVATVKGTAPDPQEPADNLKALAQEYRLNATETSDNSSKNYERPVFVVYDDNTIWIKGVSEDLPEAWVKGTYNPNTNKVTFPKGQHLGTETIWFWNYEYFLTGYGENGFGDIVMTRDATGKLTLEGLDTLLINSYWLIYDPVSCLSNVVITPIPDVTATPARPIITGSKLKETSYPYIDISIPITDVDSKPILTTKLSYRYYYEVDHTANPLTLTTDNYYELSSDMTEIPYGFTDNWDIYNYRLYLNMDFSTWNRVGIQSIYRGGGEERTSDIFWYTINPYICDVALANNTKEATNWKAAIGDGELQALPLADVASSDTIAISYSGLLKVKGVTAQFSVGDKTENAKIVAGTAANTWTMTEFLDDVTLNVEYYPVATMTVAPKVPAGVFAGEDMALVSNGETKDGTIMYALSQSNTEVPTTFTTTVPNAKSFTTQNTYYVWYYIAGDDTHSDSEPQYVTVKVSAPLPVINSPYIYDDDDPVIVAHKLALITILNKAQSINLKDISTASIQNLKDAIANAEDALKNKDVTDEELDEARIRLLIAIDNLEDKAPADADADIANGQNQENEETTGVRPIDNGQLTIENWYTLNGRKLDKKPTKKGVYILNGKKTIVK